MRVALLTDGIFPYVMGGMQRHSFYLAKYLTRHKVFVDLYHFNNSDLDIDKLEIFTDDERAYINSTVVKFPVMKKFPGHYLLESYKYSALLFDQLKPRISTYDFIYTQGFTGWKLIREKKKEKGWPPVGVNFHGYEMFQRSADYKSGLQQLMLRQPVKWISRNADLVFSFGSGLNSIIKNFGVPGNRIFKMVNAIETDWLNTKDLFANDIRRFVFIGRYERRKGIEELNEVLRSLDTENFIFEFIGPIPTAMQIVKPNVIYHGNIRESGRIRHILQNADVLVCPSHSEGMPNVILEAMASGLAIIATDVGAVSVMAGENNGRLIQPDNKQALEDAMKYFLDLDKTQLVRLKENSIDTVKSKFLWEDVIKLMITKIESFKNESLINVYAG